MLKLYHKYIIRLFLKKFIIVTLVFLSLVYILGILEEINFFKDKNTSFFLPYFLTFLNVPITLFEIFPFIFFITTQIFLYDFYNDDELDILRKNGLSNTKLIKILFLLSIFIGLFNIFVYYNIASKLKFYYSDIKNTLSDDNKYLAMVTESGLWIKDEVNGKQYIIKSNFIEDSFLFNNIINEFDTSFKLIRTIQSNKIDIEKNNWVIFNPKITIENKTDTSMKTLELFLNFDSEKINSLFSNISSFNLFKLHSLKNEYKEFGYSTDEFDIQLLKLYTSPLFYAMLSTFSAIIMLNFTKNRSLLFHLMGGILFSVLLYYVNFIFITLGNNGKIPIYPSVLFPLFIICTSSLIGLININEK